MIEEELLIKEETLEEFNKKYAIIFYNDDITSFDFVIFLLVKVFNKDAEESFMLTMKIHNEGKAIIEIFQSYEIAETKKYICENYKKNQNVPLKIEIKEI